MATMLDMSSDKLRLRICCGMHCSGGGGGKLLERAFEKALMDAGVMDQVEMWSAHCLGECESGPCVRIGTDRFYHIHADDVPNLVRNEILPRLT